MKKISWLVTAIVITGMLAITACGKTEQADSSKTQSSTPAEPKPADTAKKEEPKKEEGWTPSKPVDFIIPYNPGGGTDIMSRTIGKILQDEGIISQPFVMTNKAGGSGAIALSYVNGQRGNDHLLIGMPGFGDPLLNGTLPLKVSDFTPIALVAKDANFIIVPKNSRFESIEQLIEEIKAKPNTVTAAGTAAGGQEAFIYSSIEKKIGSEVKYVPFNSGGEVVAALLGSQVDMAIANPGEALGQIEAGEIRALAVTADERLEGFADVPTLKEKGVDFSWYMPRGVWAAGDLSDEAIAYWDEAFKKLTSSEAWQKEYVEKNVLIGDYMNSKEYAKYLEESGVLWVQFLEELGLNKK
jgi:putative tricarboxylic transport membrane protein